MADIKPSIAIWLDPATKFAKIDFTPQTLAPAEYGIVMATLIVHIARLFVESNPGTSESQLIAEIQKGILAGLSQRNDIVLPSKAH